MSRACRFLLVVAFLFQDSSVWSQSTTRPPVKASGQAAAETQPAAPTDAKLWATLTHRYEKIEFDETPLSQVFERLAELGDINVVPRWTILKKSGVTPDHPITLKLKNVTLGDVLWAVFNQFDVEETRLAFQADPDFILISTEENLGREMIVKAYPIDQFVFDYVENSDDYGDSRAVAPAVRAVNGRSQRDNELEPPKPTRHWSPEEESIFAQATDPLNFYNINKFDTLIRRMQRERQEYTRRLIFFIQATVAPDTWNIRGGPGSIVPIQGQIFVRASGFVHQKLAGMIAAAPVSQPVQAKGEKHAGQ